MPDTRNLTFATFRVDLRGEQLWEGEDLRPLNNKAFAVLRYLLEHAEQLVTRESLLEAVWPNTFVSESTLNVCIHDIRQALCDRAQTPKFLQTVRGRGFRFLAPVAVADPLPTLAMAALGPVYLVGREAEFAQLHQWLAIALQSQRQVGFIRGEAGIGKTALVNAFVDQLRRHDAIWIGHGQCIEQYGSGEAYLPVLEAIGRLGRSPKGATLILTLETFSVSIQGHDFTR